MKRLVLAVVAAVCLPLLAQAADTATLNVNMSMSAKVVGSCALSTVPTLAFGTLDPAASTDVTATGTVTFWCTKNAWYTLQAGNGAHFDITKSTRQLRGPSASDLIPYALSPAVSAGTGQGKQSPLSVTLTAKILGYDYANAAPGAYADTVLVTINP